MKKIVLLTCLLMLPACATLLDAGPPEAGPAATQPAVMPIRSRTAATGMIPMNALS